MNHRFFSDIDWIALNRCEIVPPFNPCSNNHIDDDTRNFEKEFTNMPMYSVDEPSRALSENRITSDELFSQFTYNEDNYLDRLSSRSTSKSPETYRKK